MTIDRRAPRLPPLTVILVLAAALVRAAASQDAAPEKRAPAPSASADADRLAALMSEGQEVYGANCTECHADGGVGPSLTANAALANTDKILKQLLQGSANGDMSEFGSTLTDRQIAAAATFIRNSWTNTFGVVLEADVKRLRDETAKKK